MSKKIDEQKKYLYYSPRCRISRHLIRLINRVSPELAKDIVVIDLDIYEPPTSGFQVPCISIISGETTNVRYFHSVNAFDWLMGYISSKLEILTKASTKSSKDKNLLAQRKNVSSMMEIIDQEIQVLFIPEVPSESERDVEEEDDPNETTKQKFERLQKSQMTKSKVLSSEDVEKKIRDSEIEKEMLLDNLRKKFNKVPQEENRVRYNISQTSRTIGEEPYIDLEDQEYQTSRMI